MSIMHSTKALSLTPAVQNWLANSRQPRILHLFDQACNLINEQEEVLSVVTSQIGNGPFNLVVTDDLCFSNDLYLESPVSISPTTLTLGNLMIHTAGTNLWNPQPDWQALHAHREIIANRITQLQITNYAEQHGLTTPFEDHSGLPITQSLVSNLSSALANIDISSARILTSQLAGLGAGLTPAGDDFLMGAIYAAWIIHPFEIASLLGRDVAETAAPRTTSLSAAWLRAAGKGESGIVWHQFFDALLVARIDNPSSLEESIKNILAIGETSGADALAGFMGVLTSWIERAGSSHA